MAVVLRIVLYSWLTSTSFLSSCGTLINCSQNCFILTRTCMERMVLHNLELNGDIAFKHNFKLFWTWTLKWIAIITPSIYIDFFCLLNATARYPRTPDCEKPLDTNKHSKLGLRFVNFRNFSIHRINALLTSTINKKIKIIKGLLRLCCSYRILIRSHS